MAWITLNESHVATRLTGPELAACRSAALAPGQANPLPEIVRQVINEVRGYIAANRQNTLGAGETVPDKLESCALAIIRYRLADRLPLKSLLTQERVSENEAAIRLLRDVAKGDFAVEEPTEAATEPLAGAASPRITPRTSRYGRDAGDGA